MFTRLGLFLLTPFRGHYFKRECERLERLNHELKRQNDAMSERYKEAHEMKRKFIELTMERDEWKQRALSFMEERPTGLILGG